MADRGHENLSAFQEIAGRRIERFPSLSPTSACGSFYWLGRILITTHILVKKLVSTLSIVYVHSTIRRVFVERAIICINDNSMASRDSPESPT